MLAVLVAALLAACGEEFSDSNERAGTYELEITDASLPSEQRLGQTTLLTIGVKNTGDETVPALTVTIGVGGEGGKDAGLPFGVQDQTAGLAQADRPVWVLAERYPRFVGSSKPAGSSTSNRKTFAFGKLEPGKTATAVWKLSAVKAGDWTLNYRAGAGLGTQVHAETADGDVPGGTLSAKITTELPEVEVTDDGAVVDIATDGKSSGE